MFLLTKVNILFFIIFAIALFVVFFAKKHKVKSIYFYTSIQFLAFTGIIIEIYKMYFINYMHHQEINYYSFAFGVLVNVALIAMMQFFKKSSS